MAVQFVRITAQDRPWHQPFFWLVARVFDGLDFALWADRGGWDAAYEVFAAVEYGEVVASVGRSRMRFVNGGEERAGFQLGAVATAPERRGEGLAARLIADVLGASGGAPVILFANESVIDFYPRFGFRRVRQSRFTTLSHVAPSGASPRAFVAAEPDERARLAALCARARTPRGALTAVDYYPILLWHLTYRPLRAYWLDEFDGFVVVSADVDRFTVHECLAPEPFPIDTVLPHVANRPAARVEFGFDPTGWWSSGPIAVSQDNEALVFVRDLAVPTSIRFPDLAQT